MKLLRIRQKSAFRIFDINKDGIITQDELISGSRRLGQDIMIFQAEQIMNEVKNGTKK